MSNNGVTSRGFSGPTKFSEFRRGAVRPQAPPVASSGPDPATNANATSKHNKISNPVTTAGSATERGWFPPTVSINNEVNANDYHNSQRFRDPYGIHSHYQGDGIDFSAGHAAVSDSFESGDHGPRGHSSVQPRSISTQEIAGSQERSVYPPPHNDEPRHL